MSGESAEFEVFEDEASQWRWRLISSNGEVVATSEGYDSKSNAVRAVGAMRRLSATAVLALSDEIEPVVEAEGGA